MGKGAIYIGTSGFSYKHWKGIFYPDGLPAKDWLAYYATKFSISELNTSFYHIPKKTSVQNWVETVPKKFQFCPKMSRYLTHMKKLNEPEEPLQRFFDAFTDMYNIMGPVLVQLPPNLHFNKEKAEYFYEVLKKQYKAFSFAMEVRHQSWLQAESIDLMKQYKIAFVIAEAQDKIRFPYGEFVTAKDVYVRFHGPQQLYASFYSNEQLGYYAHMFKQWKSEGHKVYAFFNNDLNGYAFKNAQTLIEMTA